MFRATWAIDVANHGSRFQKFAERYFSLSPGRIITGNWLKLTDILEVSPRVGPPFKFPNFLERNQIDKLSRSRAFGTSTSIWQDLYAVPLMLQTDDLLSSSYGRYRNAIGMAIMTPPSPDGNDGPVLHYLRIRDHLRRMGLGRRALEALWRMDCRIRIEPIPDIKQHIPEADNATLQQLMRSVLAVVPDAEIKEGEHLLALHESPHRTGQGQTQELLDQAEACYLRALKRQPDNEEAVRGLARVFRGRDQLDPQPESVDLEKDEVIPMTGEECEHQLTILHYSSGDSPDQPRFLTRGIKLLRGVIARNPYEYLAQHNLADSLMLRNYPGDRKQAIRALKEAVATHPPLRKRIANDNDFAPIRDEVLGPSHVLVGTGVA